MTWLPERSPGAVRAALEVVFPEAASNAIELRPWIETDNPEWFRGSAVIDGRFVVKFAWSEQGAARLIREMAILDALAQLRHLAPLPHVLAASNDPSLLVYRYIQGAPLTWDGIEALPPDGRHRLARALADALARLHEPATTNRIRDAGISLPKPLPQATGAEIRERLLPFVDSERQPFVRRWSVWSERVLEDDVTDPVFLQGDLHGHNVLVLGDKLQAVLDFEEATIGDPAYDFRYLPGEPGLWWLLAVADAYQARSGRGVRFDRVMAWSVRTVLGDALWRTEARVPLPGSGTETIASYIDRLADRFDELRVDVST